MRITTPLVIDKNVTKITDADGDHLLDIRGYEAFIAKGMDPDEAEEAQEEMARIIVDRLNAYEELEAGLANEGELTRQHLQTVVKLKEEKDRLEQDLCDANEAAGNELAGVLIDKIKAEESRDKAEKERDEYKLKSEAYKQLLDEYTMILRDLRSCLSGKESPEKMKKTVERLEELKV